MLHYILFLLTTGLVAFAAITLHARFDTIERKLDALLKRAGESELNNAQHTKR